MKTLYLIRHAKSDWSNIDLNDFDRPLNKRGKLDAKLMGKVLNELEIKPELIISSSSKRTVKTANKIAKDINYKKEILFIKELYHPSILSLEKELKQISNDINILFCFTHNPCINEFAYKYLNIEDNIPTTGVVQFEFDIDNWEDINRKKVKKGIFIYPKMYK